MLDQIAGIRTIIDRGDVPNKLRFIIEKLEESGPLDDLSVSPDGEREVREILQLNDGATLLAAIVVRILKDVPVESRGKQRAAETRIKSDFELWEEAAVPHGGLTLLLINDGYVAYDHHAERIAEVTGSHVQIVGRNTIVRLPLATQADWQEKIVEANLDVTLAEQQEDGTFIGHSLLDADKLAAQEVIRQQEQANARPLAQLDHDNNGSPGGSLPGDQSTAHKGAVKRKSAGKTPAKKTPAKKAAPTAAA